VALVTPIKGAPHETNEEQVHRLILPTHEKVQDVGPQGVVGIACNRQQDGHKRGRTLIPDPTDGRSARRQIRRAMEDDVALEPSDNVRCTLPLK
jgi:hypothetical protein